MEKIKIIGVKYKSNIKLIDEYNTSKMCNNCGNIKKDLGAKKVYECRECKFLLFYRNIIYKTVLILKENLTIIISNE